MIQPQLRFKVNDGSDFPGWQKDMLETLTQKANRKAEKQNALAEEGYPESLIELLEKNPTVKREDIPADLLIASRSGLDPHISPESAEGQVPRIAEASGLDEFQKSQYRSRPKYVTVFFPFTYFIFAQLASLAT